MAPNPSRDALTIKRIVRVNHAGEYGAIRIYGAQIWVASRFFPDVVPALADMLAHEREHCDAFLTAMPKRHSRPCRVMPFWSWGGWLLGFTTALAGRQGIWACTAAVEETVHRHLDDQLHFLKQRDPELHAVIAAIREEELSHLRYARDHLEGDGIARRSMRAAIGAATEILIWLSTWGDSTRMAGALRAAD